MSRPQYHVDSASKVDDVAIMADANRTLLRDNEASESLAELAKLNVAPFLNKHNPRQYAPLRSEDGTPVPRPANAGYCYRHQPDSKCRRQADEHSMRQLQQVCARSCP
jgi:F-box/WD-40 domain protein MET30